MTQKPYLLTPVGRLVMGDPFEPDTTDAEGKPLTVRTGPNAGAPRVEYFVAIAIPKTDLSLRPMIDAIRAVGTHAFPRESAAASFAWKYADGDSTVANRKGKRPCDREGFPGHVVFFMGTSIAPSVWTRGGAERLTWSKGDPIKPIKRGDYIRVNFSVSGNGSSQNPGVYLNPSMIELVGYGDEIVSGPQAADIFGAAPAALPPGASQTPTAPATSMAPATVAAPAAYPATGPAPAGYTPAHDFVRGAPAPAAYAPPVAPAPAPAAPAAPVAPARPEVVLRIHPDGKAYPEETLRAAGWTAPQIAALPVAGDAFGDDVPF